MKLRYLIRYVRQRIPVTFRSPRHLAAVFRSRIDAACFRQCERVLRLRAVILALEKEKRELKDELKGAEDRCVELAKMMIPSQSRLTEFIQGVMGYSGRELSPRSVTESILKHFGVNLRLVEGKSVYINALRTSTNFGRGEGAIAPIVPDYRTQRIELKTVGFQFDLTIGEGIPPEIVADDIARRFTDQVRTFVLKEYQNASLLNTPKKL